MKILLVSATKFEVAPLMKILEKISGKGNIPSYKFGKHTIDVLISGVGMTATAFHLGKVFTKRKPVHSTGGYDLAINAGVAGSFRKNISLGTVVNVTSDCFGDLGAEDGEKFLLLKEIGLLQRSEFRATGSEFKVHLPKVKAITVNKVHGNNSSIKKIVRKFNPDIETMEGAAFLYACKEEKIKCVQLRAISNYVERRNKKKWKMNLALKNLNSVLLAFLKSI